MKELRMNRRLAAIGVTWAVVALLVGACSTTPPTPSPTPTAATAPESGSAPEKPAWLVEWEETVQKGKEEGELIITGGSAAIEYRPVYGIFEQKFGIKVKSSGGLSREVSDRILAERAAGRAPQIDIMLSGGTTLGKRMIPNNALAPIMEALILPEVTDGSNWYEGHLWFGIEDREAKYMLTYSATVDTSVVSGWYNEEQLTPEELSSIESVWDLVDPQFSGRVVGTSPDFTSSGWDSVWFHPEVGEEWYHLYFAPEFNVTLMSDPRLIADQLALGKFAMCLPCANVGRPLRDLQALGAPVFQFGGAGGKHEGFKEQAFLSTTGARSNLGLIDGGPNPNAAKVFLNWFLSKEGQTSMHLFAQGPRPTLRLDVTEMGVTVPAERREPGKEYVELDRVLPNFEVQQAEVFDKIMAMFYEWAAR